MSQYKTKSRLLLRMGLVLTLTLLAKIAEAGYKTWTPIGPTGTPVYALAVDPRTPAVVYAGTQYGVYVTTNGGTNWIPRNNGFDGYSIHVIAVDPQSPSTVYAGTWPGDGIYKSTDGGHNWKQISRYNPPYISAITDLAIDPNMPSTLYVSTPGSGVAKSTNGGDTWSYTNNGLIETPYHGIDANTIAIDPHVSSILYVGTTLGVFKSTDSAASWKAVDLNTGSSLYVFDIAVSRQNSAVIWVGTDDRLYKTTDGGVTWELKGAYRGPLLIDPQSSSIVWTGIYKSTDGGTNWSCMDNGLGGNSIDIESAAMALDPSNPTTVYAGAGRGIFKTNNGGANWTELKDTALIDIPISSLVIKPPELIAGSSTKGVFWTNLLESNTWWRTANWGLRTIDVHELAINPRTEFGNWSIAYVGTDNGSYYGSADSIGSPNWYDSISGKINALAIERSTQICYASLSMAGVFKSQHGLDWQAVNNGLLASSSGAVYVYSLAVDDDTLTVYAGTGGGVYKSTDAGQNWTAVNAGMADILVTAIAVDSIEASTLYAGTVRGVYKSTDGGLTWNAVNRGLTGLGLEVNDIAIGYTSFWKIGKLVREPLLYAATWDGVFRSTDGGTSWTAMSAGWPTEPGYKCATALAVDPYTNAVYAGTAGGVYQIQWEKFDPRRRWPQRFRILKSPGQGG